MSTIARLIVFLGVAGGAVASPVPPARLLLDTDFGANLRPFSTGRVTGVLPEGWKDNSGWCLAKATCEPATEEGARFLRIHVSSVEGGRLQLVATNALPDLQEEAVFLLHARLRNRTAKPVQMLIRMGPPPYRIYAQAECEPTLRFRDFSFELPCVPNEKPMGFFLIAQATGIVDVARVRLELVERAAYLETLRSRHSGNASPANLLRNTRLPLGLPGGWFVVRGRSVGDHVRIASDPAVPGPSGAPSLRLEAPLYSDRLISGEPFTLAVPFFPHQFSFWAKGTGRWRFVLAGDSGLGTTTNLTLHGGDWRRIVIPFTPAISAKVYQMGIGGEGTLWLDGLQAGPADSAGTDYTPGALCEVALALPESGEADDLSFERIQFVNQSARVRYCVSGHATNAILRARVINLYGEVRDLRPRRLRPDFLNWGEFDYAVFPHRPLGQFRIEAWVERDGVALSLTNELVVTRLDRPKYWGRDAPDSPFGVHMFADRQMIRQLKAAGINWTRLHDAGMDYIGWYYLEPQPGQWRFRDAELQRFREYGVRIFAELGTAPKWATMLAGVEKPWDYTEAYCPPRNLADFEKYVHTVVTRYRDVITDFDVWNEPWQATWWPLAYTNGAYLFNPNSDREFAALQAAAFRAAKAANPVAVIAGFNTTTLPNMPGTIIGGREFTAGVLMHGGWDTCDVVAYHGYCSELAGFPGDEVEKGLDTALGPIRERFGGTCPKPVWMTEGYPGPTAHKSGFWWHVVPEVWRGEDYHTVANAMARYHLALLGNGVSRVFVYSAHCYWGYAGAQLQAYVSGDGYLHPSAVAIAALARELEDRRFVRRSELAPDVYAYLFSDAERTVAALCRKPGSATVFRIAGGRRLVVRDLYGNPLPRGAQLGDTPVYVSAPLTPDDLEGRLRNP